MTYRRIRNQELSIKIKPTNSSSNILYEPDFIFNDVKQYLEKKYPDELLIDSQEKVGIDFFTKKILNNEKYSLVTGLSFDTAENSRRGKFAND